MDEVDKLSCKEELDLSDVEHSTNDDHKDVDDKPKKRKKRRREIDLIKLSDDDSDEEASAKKSSRRFSPGPHSPASHREPRSCVLKASQKRRPLSRLLEQLLRNLEKKDPHQFFAWPVNDNFAPNYSNIIKRPMDFSTMKQKIDDNEYRSLNCFINDFKLMCNNAMKYNKPGTVYHKAARRLLHAGLRQLAPQKLRPLGSILTYMYEIPLRELGFDIGKMDLHKVLKRASPIKSGGSEAEAVSDGGGGDERGEEGEHRVKIKMERAREQHRRRLAKKAFPRMDAEGTTTLCLVADTPPAGERLTLGQYIGKLTQGTGSLHSLREDRRNLVKGVKPLQYGPFSSHAPAFDGTFATLTHQESHLLYHTLPSETGQGNEEMLRFAADSPWRLFYDMDELFPPRRKPDSADGTDSTDANAAEEQDPSMKVDIDELRSLAELGIDVEFLSDVEAELAAAKRDYGIAGALRQTNELLRRLEKEQLERLSMPLPSHLGSLAGPRAAERAAAAGAAAALRGMAAKVPPRALAPLPALRAAMGVTLTHLDTPLSTECVEEPRDAEHAAAATDH